MRITRSGKYLNEEPKDSTLNDRIKNQQKYFKWYYRLPLILAIAIIVLSFIWGIVDPCAFRSGTYDICYGIMQLSDGFLCWLIWMLIGSVTAAIEYILGKIFYSQKILTVLYLQKLNEDKYD